MPQMAPISWLSLFLLLSVIFILFNKMKFFLYLLRMPKSKTSDKMITQSMNWKW